MTRVVDAINAAGRRFWCPTHAVGWGAVIADRVWVRCDRCKEFVDLAWAFQAFTRTGAFCGWCATRIEAIRAERRATRRQGASGASS